MKIGIFDEQKNITGGEKYNTLFFSTLEDFGGEVSYLGRTKYKAGINIYKLLAPIVELKFLKQLKQNEIFFFSDTLAFRQILLLIVIKFLFRKRCISILHHYSSDFKHGFRKKIFHFFESVFFLSCTDIIVVSPYTLDLVKNKYSTSKIHYIPIPFNKSWYEEDTHIPGKLLYVGTIEERKGLMKLLEALSIINDKCEFNLYIVGKVISNSYFNKCRQFIKEHALNEKCSFLGRVEDTELEYLYKTSDFFILPSMLEGYGMVLIEAMSYGLPVVAFNNSAIPYTVVPFINGLLAENGSETNLAENIKLLVKNRELKEQLRKGTQETLVNINSYNNFRDCVSQFYNVIK